MSTPNRRARRSAEREMARLLRRMETQPDRPILRAAERLRGEPSSSLPPAGGPGRGGDAPMAPPTPVAFTPRATNPASPIRTPPHAPDSPLPEWARGLILPPGLDDDFRAGLYHFIEHHVRPRDRHEHRLAARIARAWARLELNARREPADQPGPLWLRYETLADRQLRQAERDLAAYRASLPPPTESPTPTAAAPPTPTATPQTQPIPRNTTFARPSPPPRPMPGIADPIPAYSRDSQAPPMPLARPPDPR